MKKQLRRFLTATFAIIALALAIEWLLKSLAAGQSPSSQTSAPRYIFIFLADGAGITTVEMTRLYNRQIHKEGLVLSDKIMKEGSLGLLTTHAADSLTTDSAAAATALASGCKAKISALGKCADGRVPKTALEVAKEKGMRIGLVTNSTIYDASPAAFACHVPDRKLYASIITQYLNLAPDLLMGGGRDQFLPMSQPGSLRKDNADVIGLFKEKGYTYVSNKKELMETKGARVLGLFSMQEMSFELDRDKNVEPSVYDMTAAAIRILEAGNQRGFVVFIETENTDSAGHLTDIASTIQDFREFDRAVGLAYEFYRRHPRETLILVTSDHETGGVALSGAVSDTGPMKGKAVFPTEEDLKKIESIKISIKTALEIIGTSPSANSLDRLVAEHFKGFTLSPDVRNAILTRQPLSRTFYYNAIASSLGMMIAHNTQAYWMTTTHTNHPVFVAALGVGADRFRGYQDNTDFGKNLRAILEGIRSH